MEPNPEITLKRGFFNRLFGKCLTKLPVNENCWIIKDDTLQINLECANELFEEGGAIRIEGENLTARILVVLCEDGVYRAYRNHCTHGGRRLDPVKGAATIQCCSLGKSTFDYDGKILSGSAKADIETFEVQMENGNLIIDLSKK